MTEIARHTLADEYRRIDSASARVVLLEGSAHILGSFGPKLSQKACEQLERLGVDVRTSCRVVGIDAEGVHYQRGTAEGEPERLPAKTVIWAAGVAASSLGKAVAASAGVPLDRAGRVIVEPDLSLAGHPEVFVVGDLAAARSYGKGEPKPVPGVSPGAKQMGRAAARNLLRRLQGVATEPFHYTDYGNLATIGRRAAVVDLTVPLLGNLRFSGLVAWLFWLVTHIWFLIGFRSRLMVMTDWAWSYFTYQRSARVVAAPPSVGRDSAAPP